MVAVGRAMMAQPRYLVCDELSLGLAPMIVAQLFELLSEVSTAGVGVLTIEQNARLAMQYTHHGYVIELGRVVIDGPCASLRSDTVVQDLYLGGGEDTADFLAAVRRPRRWKR
jgi:branched-chain amino acid transport system ATP-binding protein